jgi:hypothetical protein
MKRGTALELVVRSGLVVGPGNTRQPHVFDANRTRVNIHLLATIDQTLLCRWDTLLLLNALLYPRDLVTVSIYHLLLTILCVCPLAINEA